MVYLYLYYKIEEHFDGESLYQIDRDKFRPFEFTRFLSALAAFLSDRADLAFDFDYSYFAKGSQLKRSKEFLFFALDRQERMPIPRRQADELKCKGTSCSGR